MSTIKPGVVVYFLLLCVDTIYTHVKTALVQQLHHAENLLPLDARVCLEERQYTCIQDILERAFWCCASCSDVADEGVCIVLVLSACQFYHLP